ncbi:hypothetical protein BDY24DRAFT_386212 [Mrakia frigida]|uniref:uncharacterized protein n=1 Tax=Mrakia frigida TaxID=29902 RepID=UPI003FCC21E3
MNGRFRLGLGLASNGRADPGNEMEERRRDKEGGNGSGGRASISSSKDLGLKINKGLEGRRMG